VEETFFIIFLNTRPKCVPETRRKTQDLCEQDTTLKQACHNILSQWNVIQTQITQQSVNIYS